eukprot:scaffold32546_cov21-Tisochrysis_lutea.AAC.1
MTGGQAALNKSWSVHALGVECIGKEEAHGLFAHLALMKMSYSYQGKDGTKYTLGVESRSDGGWLYGGMLPFFLHKISYCFKRIGMWIQQGPCLTSCQVSPCCRGVCVLLECCLGEK